MDCGKINIISRPVEVLLKYLSGESRVEIGSDCMYCGEAEFTIPIADLDEGDHIGALHLCKQCLEELINQVEMAQYRQAKGWGEADT